MHRFFRQLNNLMGYPITFGKSVFSFSFLINQKCSPLIATLLRGGNEAEFDVQHFWGHLTTLSSNQWNLKEINFRTAPTHSCRSQKMRCTDISQTARVHQMTYAIISPLPPLLAGFAYWNPKSMFLSTFCCCRLSPSLWAAARWACARANRQILQDYNFLTLPTPLLSSPTRTQTPTWTVRWCSRLLRRENGPCGNADANPRSHYGREEHRLRIIKWKFKVLARKWLLSLDFNLKKASRLHSDLLL